MKQWLVRPRFYAVMMTLFTALSNTTDAQAATLRFVAEFSTADSSKASSATLDVTFYDAQPGSQQAQDVLRKCLEAAIATDQANDITASAWFSTSANGANKQPVELASGGHNLSYNAKDKTIHVGAGSNSSASVATHGESGSSQEDDRLAAITGSAKVVKSCQDIKPKLLATLASMGNKERGSERRVIVKVMRTWCKDNGIGLDRKMRSCMSAISKAILAAQSAAGMNPKELAEAVARGADAYNIGECGNCHESNGRGSLKGPDLTDNKWLHCDGSIAGIRKVLVSGVPQNKIKDPSRPFAMDPATNLISDQKQLSDLAVYVQSLNKK